MFKKLRYVALLTVAAALPAFAQYLSPEEAGFHHLALVYTHSGYNEDMFKTMLCKYVDGKPTAQAGFDGFLFLTRNLPDDRVTEVDPTFKVDWEWQHNDHFFKAINVPALAKAVDELRAAVGVPVENPKLVFSVPWLHPSVTDFGDVDGDGVGENLATVEGRAAVINWHIDVVTKEMEKYPQLDLHGFYMMREGMGGSAGEIAREVGQVVRDRGYKMVWIPSYEAAGYDQWRELGFDSAFFQSNWTFTNSLRNRVYNTAAHAARHGAGFEFELFDQDASPAKQQQFLEALEIGSKLGLQESACAYYFGAGFVIPNSEDAGLRHVYSVWMDFLAGKPITAPPRGGWEQTVEGDVVTAIYKVGDIDGVPVAVDVFFEPIFTSSDTLFAGMVTAEYSTRERPNEFIPGSWLMHLPCLEDAVYIMPSYVTPENEVRQTIDCWVSPITSPPYLHPYRAVTLPLPGKEIDSVRITLTPKPGTAAARIQEFDIQFEAEAMLLRGKSTRRAYTSSFPLAQGAYPDVSGRVLLDGVTGGDDAAYAGWHSTPLSVTFDLGEEVKLNRASLFIGNDEARAINIPTEVTTIFSRGDAPYPYTTGFGEPPQGDDVSYVGGYSVVDTEHGAMITPRMPQGTVARYVTFVITEGGWIFLAEAEFFSNGEKLAKDNMSYTFNAPPVAPRRRSRSLGEDTGTILNNGILLGWSDRGGLVFENEMHATFDMGELLDVSEVIAHFADGEHNGVPLAERLKMSVEISVDGASWESIPASAPEFVFGGSAVKIASARIFFAPQKARFVKISIAAEGKNRIGEIIVN